MVKFICKECGYRFEREQNIRVCPYCGKKEVTEEQDAEELVKDVEKILE